ncbi:hypothetical protein CFC21_023561 [Triticum aestivum]|uniref:Dirigent protein n=4 Tax=Triticinae TaxID=1648030 RepID=A0A9R1EFJ8_WHEAT|nr:uncharacterized protein LOC123066882 [Triticum aestivum]KAF7008912.1 hypothetical protein CFC21_023561 [Triticum aestivum]CDM86905.1 unnamed protein product [Triticum aestivum]
MDNFKITSYANALVENTKLDFQSLYLHRIRSGDKKNQYVVIDGVGATDICLTTINDWAIYDGVAAHAKLVAHAKGMHMNAAAADCCNLFIIVFELDSFKGSTLAVMGATTEEQGEWAIVGGTGQFAMARGVIQRKMHQKLADGQGDVLELTIEAFCRRKGQPEPPATTPQTPTTQPIQPPVQPPPATTQPIQPPVQPPPAPTKPIQPPTPTPIKNGPWGGTTSDKLHHFNPNMSVGLKSVTFIYYHAVNGLRFNYTGKDGYENSSELFGNNGHGPDAKRQTVHLGPREFVTELSGTHQHERRSNNIAIYSLKLVTNLGKTHGPFGSANIGAAFRFSVPPNSKIVGFFGGSTGYAVNSIGAYTLENSA